MSFRIRGTTLPDRQTRTLVIDGDRLHIDESSAVELVSDGGWILPGLVDVHTHPGSDKPNTEFTEAQPAQGPDRPARCGCPAGRVPGSPERLPAWVDEDPELPRVQSAGNWLVQPETFYPGSGRRVAGAELVAAAVEEAKVVGRLVQDRRRLDAVGPCRAGRGADRGGERGARDRRPGRRARPDVPRLPQRGHGPRGQHRARPAPGPGPAGPDGGAGHWPSCPP